MKSRGNGSRSFIGIGVFVATLYAVLVWTQYPAKQTAVILAASAAGLGAGYLVHLLTRALVSPRVFGGVALLRDWVWVSLAGVLSIAFAVGCIGALNGFSNMDLPIIGNALFWVFLVLPVTHALDVMLKLNIDGKVPVWMRKKMGNDSIEETVYEDPDGAPSLSGFSATNCLSIIDNPCGNEWDK